MHHIGLLLHMTWPRKPYAPCCEGEPIVLLKLF